MGVPRDCDLAGVRLKLDRAREHIEAIRERVDVFTGRTPPPFGFRVEQRDLDDGEGVEYTLYAVVREQPPRELAPMIGDAVHNIRSALDHLVYELSSAKARKSGKTQFPIFTDDCRYKVLGEPMIRGIRGDERLLIERVQPWYAASASSPAVADPLAVLNRLSNLDKHRLLVPAITGVALNEVSVASSNALIDITFVQLGAVEDGDEAVIFTARPVVDGERMTVHPRSGLHITLSPAETRVDWNRSLDELLSVLHHHVSHTVIDMWFTYGALPPERPA
jgi:hypothetical protein